MTHSALANQIAPYRQLANHRPAWKQELRISSEFIKDTRWFNAEVETGNNYIEVNFKKTVMIKSFAYRAGLNGGSTEIFFANFK